MNPYAYQTPAGLPAKPQQITRRASKSPAIVWRVLGPSGWRMPTSGEAKALRAAYGDPQT